MAAEQRKSAARLAKLEAAAAQRGVPAHYHPLAALEGADGGGVADDGEARDGWTLGGFIASIGLSDSLAEAMLTAHKEQREGWTWFQPSAKGPVNELDFVRQLAASAGSAGGGRKRLVELLSQVMTSRDLPRPPMTSRDLPRPPVTSHDLPRPPVLSCDLPRRASPRREGRSSGWRPSCGAASSSFSSPRRRPAPSCRASFCRKARACSRTAASPRSTRASRASSARPTPTCSKP